MRLVLDGKSVAVGVFAGAALVAGLGAMQHSGPEIGRFQIAAGQRAFVIDTATGRVWIDQSVWTDPLKGPATTDGGFIATKMNDQWK